jgi:undecaprenyl-diphosphatase
MARLSELSDKLLGFVRRHPWSLSLGLLSSLCFAKLAVEIREGELDAFDKAGAAVAAEWRGQLDGLMFTLTRMGDWVVMLSVAVLLVLLLIARSHRKAALFLALSASGGPVLNHALKILFQRARPDDTFDYFIQTPASFSFPSGHAMGSMCVLGGIVVVAHVMGLQRFYRLGITLLAAAFILGIGLSRVYFGVHYLSDVLGGQLAGAAWVSAITGWFYPRLLPGEQTVIPAPQTD